MRVVFCGEYPDQRVEAGEVNLFEVLLWIAREGRVYTGLVDGGRLVDEVRFLGNADVDYR